MFTNRPYRAVILYHISTTFAIVEIFSYFRDFSSQIGGGSLVIKQKKMVAFAYSNFLSKSFDICSFFVVNSGCTQIVTTKAHRVKLGFEFVR
ncbi:MAG: hypothetical protein A3J46_04690 [Candidatus Yanofskybacteria bacterium RIFCSPHIGHO2_02_FULL_41_11]|uniref:Uncharacterized protein n=1 Tax=Candidatus Yanofskybacteria bacterium RIFCSPHIGHO2_02_FULL_41_11 TaxID=1802675 RepID=A0A1F8F9M1_9BACT|nr:MAG: hypothetical protein A3J46_04690 [Candidatus Yanofskybacteria bacterium RIFCSPHIGHO2_02_FULL_41_11]